MRRKIHLAWQCLGLVAVLQAVVAARGDDNGLPGSGFPADRYHMLWSSSPFAVATPEAAASSPDFSLVGIAQFDGVSYASLIDKSNSEHFLLSSTTPAHGLKLTSLIRGSNGSESSAVVQRNGEMLTLKLEAAPAVPNGGMPNGGAPGTGISPSAILSSFPNNIMPGANPMPGSQPPQAQHRRFRPITIPPPPTAQGYQPASIPVPPNQGH